MCRVLDVCADSCVLDVVGEDSGRIVWVDVGLLGSLCVSCLVRR